MCVQALPTEISHAHFAQEDEMVARMLLFRKNMLSVLHNSFASHADFAQALKEGV